MNTRKPRTIGRMTGRSRAYRIRQGLTTALLVALLSPSTWTRTEALTPSASPRKYPSRPNRGETWEPRQGRQTTTSVQAHSTAAASSTSQNNRKRLSPAEMERRIVTLGRQGKTDEALEFFESLPRPSIRQINAAIDACARARPVRLEEAFEIQQTAAVPPNVYTFGSLMNACARAGNVNRARSVLRDMQSNYGVTPNAVVYHAAVKACDRAQPPQPDVAWKLLAEAREIGLALSVVGYNTAMSAAARAGQVEEAVALLNLMNSSDDDPLVPIPDAVTYGTVLAVFERAGEWEQLFMFADRMQKEGHALDGMAITSILHACQHLGLAKEAMQYLERMKTVGPYRRQTAGSEVAGGRAPIQGPDAVAYLLAISACARGGAWKEGIQLLGDYDLHGGSADVAVYTAAVRGCELAGEFAAALTLVERMRQLRIDPNEMTFAAVMGACATACARAKDDEGRQVPLNKALRLLRVLKKDPSTIDPNIQIYNAAIRAAAESLQMEQAFALVEDVESQGLEANVVTFGTLMSAAERAGSLDGVNRVFQLMRQAGVEPNEVVYGAALSCCRKAGDAERALLLLRKMIRDGLEANIVTFNTVLTAQVEVKGRGPKELDRAVIVFQLVCSNKYSDAGPNRQTYNLMTRFLAQCQRPQEAEVLLHKMRQDGLVPDVDLYTAVVAVYERSGQPLKALRLMESMNVDGYDFYEAKVLNAAFKRALKVVNVVGRGFTGVHDVGGDGEKEAGQADPSNFATLQQSQKESERFLQGKRIQAAE